MERLKKVIEAAKGPQIEVAVRYQNRFYRAVLEGVRLDEPESLLVALEKSPVLEEREVNSPFELFLRTENPKWTLIALPFWRPLPIGLDDDHRWVAAPST